MKIFLNAGHGGSDPGACGNGLRESIVAFSIGARVELYLRKVGYDVKLFQLGGVDDDLPTICDACNDWGADLFVSIHCNAGGGTGTETYHFYGSDISELLAICIQRQIVNSLPVEDRGVKQAGFFVLAQTDCPAVLVETAFIDNPADADLLRPLLAVLPTLLRGCELWLSSNAPSLSAPLSPLPSRSTVLATTPPNSSRSLRGASSAISFTNSRRSRPNISSPLSRVAPSVNSSIKISSIEEVTS